MPCILEPVGRLERLATWAKSQSPEGGLVLLLGGLHAFHAPPCADLSQVGGHVAAHVEIQ